MSIDTIAPTPERLNAYRTCPQKERKAAFELRQEGIRCYVPKETRERRASHHRKAKVKFKHPIAPGYVFAERRPPFAYHVQRWIGPIERRDLLGLYKASRPKPRPPLRQKFALGDEIKIKVGPFAEMKGTISGLRGRIYNVDVSMFGRISTIALHEKHMHRIIDYG